MTENTAAGRKYGYVRVSSRDQNEDRQMIAMKQEGIEGKTSSLISSRERTLTDLHTPECSGN